MIPLRHRNITYAVVLQTGRNIYIWPYDNHNGNADDRFMPLSRNTSFYYSAFCAARHSHPSDHAQPPSTTFNHHHAIYITLSSPLISFLRLPIRTTWGGAQPHPPFLRIDLGFVVQLLAPILASLPPRSHREIPIFSHHSHSSSTHSPMTQSPHGYTHVPHFRPTDTRPCLVRSPASSHIARAF